MDVWRLDCSPHYEFSLLARLSEECGSVREG